MSRRTLTKSTYEPSWSSYNLDYMGYLVFQALQQNPTETLSNLASQLGVSITVIRSRLTRLKEIGFLRPDKEVLVPLFGKRQQTEVEAVYNPSALGLTRLHVVVYGIPDRASFVKLNEFLSVHPYTRYYSGSFTHGADIYCQFDMPRTSKSILKDTLRILMDQDLIDGYTIFIPDHIDNTSTDFSNWDIPSRDWITPNRKSQDISLRSDIDDFFHDAVSMDPIQEAASNQVPPISNYDEVDMKLVRELNVNSKISTVELAKIYDLDQSTISRRLAVLRENVIEKNLLFFDKRAFNLEFPTLFFGNFRKRNQLNEETLRSLVTQTDLPFSSALASNPNKFFWLVTLPTRKIIEYAKFLWQHTRKFQMLNLDLMTSKSFYFLHTNYLGDGNWNTSREHIMQKPLEAIPQ